MSSSIVVSEEHSPEVVADRAWQSHTELGCHAEVQYGPASMDSDTHQLHDGNKASQKDLLLMVLHGVQLLGEAVHVNGTNTFAPHCWLQRAPVLSSGVAQ